MKKVAERAGSRKRGTEEDFEVDVELCRENLLSHIIGLEKTLDQRLTQLEDYVSSKHVHIIYRTTAQVIPGIFREVQFAESSVIVYPLEIFFHFFRTHTVE